MTTTANPNIKHCTKCQDQVDDRKPTPTSPDITEKAHENDQHPENSSQKTRLDPPPRELGERRAPARLLVGGLVPLVLAETRPPVALRTSPELFAFTMTLAPPVHPSPIFLTDTENW